MLDALKALWKDDRLFLRLVFLVALALRLGYFARSHGVPQFPDERDYLSVAAVLQEMGGFPPGASRPPLYPVVLSLLPEPLQWDSRGRGLPTLAFLQSLVGAATCVLVARLGRALLDSDAGKWAAVLLAFHPYSIYFASHALVETLLAVMVATQVWALLWARWAYEGPPLIVARLPAVVLCGGICGLTVLLHAGHLAFAAVGIVLLLTLPPSSHPIDSRITWFGRSLWIGFYALAAFLPVAFWAAHVREQTGNLIPVTTKLGTDLYEAFGPEATGRTQKDKISWPPEEHPGMTEVERDLQLRRLAWEHIKADPARALWLGVKKVAYTWNPFPNWEGAAKWYYWVASGVVCLPIILGALLSPFVLRGVPRRTLAILWAPILYYTALHFVFVGSVRYRMAFEPCLIVLAAATWVAVWKRARGTGRSPAPGQ